MIFFFSYLINLCNLFIYVFIYLFIYLFIYIIILGGGVALFLNHFSIILDNGSILIDGHDLHFKNGVSQVSGRCFI